LHEAVYEECPTCNHKKLLEHPVYRVPNKPV